MRILHLTDRWTDRGGAYTHLMGIVEHLAQAGHDITVAAGVIDAHPPPCRLHQIASLSSRVAAEADIDGLLARADVVHIHTVMNPIALARAVRHHGSVVTVQDHRVFCPGRGKLTHAGELCTTPARQDLCAGCFDDRVYADAIWVLTQQRKTALQQARAIIVLSRYMSAELAREGFPPERIRVIPPFPHGLDPKAEPSGPPCVLFVGRLTSAKGVWDAVDAWRQAKTGIPLVFAGAGSERGALEREGFEVLGWLDRPALSAAYRRARVLVLPPRWQEPYGIVGIEAHLMGVPVAAWRSGGIEDWLGAVPAHWGDVAALAERITVLARGAHPRHVPSPPEASDQMARLIELYTSLGRKAQSSD